MSRFETFSFLPPLTTTQVQSQANNMLRKGHVPMIEYTDTPQAGDIYWRMWVLPNETQASPHWVMSQVDACSRRFPFAYIRLSGFDPKAQVYKSSFLVKVPVEVA